MNSGKEATSSIIATLVLGMSGACGFIVSIPLFLDISLSFGSIFVVLAVLRYGTRCGIAVALIAGSSAWAQGGHFIALALLAGEALFVGLLMRQSRNVVLLDTLFWFGIGMPVSLVSYRIIMECEIPLSLLLTLKDGVNGILNSFVALLLFHLVRLLPFFESRDEHNPAMREVLATLLLAVVLIPGACYVIIEMKNDVKERENHVRHHLESTIELTRDLMGEWLMDKMRSVEHLASQVGDPQKVPAARIQKLAEAARDASPHLLKISVQNTAAVAVAFVPPFDDEGRSNVGNDYSRMPYHRFLRATLRPVFSDIDFGIAEKNPRVALFAPIIREEAFRGYCTGVIELPRLKEQLHIIGHNYGIDITLLDRKRQVIASTRPGISTMQRLEAKAEGELRRLPGKAYLVLPPTDHTDARRWQDAAFGMDDIISSDIPWTIVLSAPMKNFLDTFYRSAGIGFAFLLLLIIFSLVAAQTASAAFVRPVTSIEKVTADLPDRVMLHQEVQWPQSRIREVARLISNITHMAGSIQDSFTQLQSLNESLEQRVAERTAELGRSEQKFRAIFTNAGMAMLLGDSERRIIDCNPAAEHLLGYTRNELLERTIPDISHPDDERTNAELGHRVRETGEDVFRMEKRYVRKDGSLVWGNLTESFIRPAEGEPGHYTIGMVEDISERKRAEEEIRQLAYFDPLTKLPNRTLFMDRLNQSLAHARRSGSIVAILFLDLDKFKDINDTLGHATGDLLLVSVARRLERVVRQSDTFARLGGDEFVVILTGCKNEKDVETAAQHIMEEMNTPFELAGNEAFISTSIGIVLFPGDGEDMESLLMHADMALYAAKKTGRNAYNFFSHDMNRKAVERRNLENSLRQAVQNDEFFLSYQPLLDLHKGTVFGVEALLRWDHPELGLISPDRFIPVAEEMGIIRRIGEWVLRNACLQSRAWGNAGLPLQVAVNISGFQFNQPGFLDMIDDVLMDTGADPSRLELELTESSLMEGERDTIDLLIQLKLRGLRLSIDDFGTGYSSLSYLKHFPLDRIKIDRSFIRDIVPVLDDRAIVEAIIVMAHTLGLRVLAEGVEHEEELEILRELGCDEAQGYFFSRAVPPNEVGALVTGSGPDLSMRAACYGETDLPEHVKGHNRLLQAD